MENLSYCLLLSLALKIHFSVKTRTTQRILAELPRVVAPVEAALLEQLFDQAPDVAFFRCYPYPVPGKPKGTRLNQLSGGANRCEVSGF